MNRKHFLSSMLTAAVGGPALAAGAGRGMPASLELIAQEEAPLVPPYLKPGDTIGITCPAGFISPEAIRPAIQQMESWGFRVRLGETVGKRDYSFGGSDADRAQDLQQFLDDPSVRAIMCARGGYGAVRLVDRLNFTRFAAHPKWIIGFSDITVLHCHLSRNYQVASIHSKMCNSFPDDWSLADPIQVATILSIKKALQGEKMAYTAMPSAFNRAGAAEGVLVGGNLKTIESLAGSPSDLRTEGKILFVEDTGEYMYSIDRMFWNLKRSGKLDRLAGLIIGGFKVKPDDPGEEFGRMLQDVVLEKLSGYAYPVCFDFPVGHQRNNFALKCGVKHRLRVGSEGVTLAEL